MESDFYKDKFFNQMANQMADMQTSIANMETKLDSINQKVVYIYGFAAAIGFVSSLLITWITNKVTNGH